MFQHCMILTGSFHASRMDSSTKELKTAQSKQPYVESDDPKDCGFEDRHVHFGPAGTAFWEEPPSDASLPEIVSHPHQQTIHPGMVDPHSFRCTVHLLFSFFLAISFRSLFSFSVGHC